MKTVKRSAIYVAMFFLLIGIAAPSAMLAQEEPDWTIYFHPGIRFGTDDRVIGFYDVLVPVYLTDTSMLFVNPRFSHDSTHGHEWNLGGGYRQILWDNQLMLGLNAYYDLKKDGRSGYWFDQWGMGFEAMGEFDNVIASGGGLGLTGRFNFYVPLSGSKTEGGVGVGGGGYTFMNLGIYGGGGGVVYEPLTGLDYEMGMRIPYLSEYVETWAYAGGYHYWGKESGNMDGFCGRIEVIPTDFVALDFEYRNDNWYGDEFYGEVKVEVPFSIGNLVEGKNPFEGLGSRFGGSRTLAERMSEPVRRDIDIKIETVETGDPTTTGGLIEEVIFVSEGGEADPAPDGTFEHPYASINDAMNDPRIGVTAFTIHVINDDGANGMVDFTAFVNIPNILVWGSGVPHPSYGAVCGMCSGYPDIDGLLRINADNVEVCGMNLLSTLEVLGGTGTTVHHNQFNGPGSGFGMYVGSSTNSLSVFDNLFRNRDEAIYIVGGTGFNLSYNDIADCSWGIYSSNAGDLSITGNSIETTEYGIFLSRNDGADLAASITGNTITVDNSGTSGGAEGIYMYVSGVGNLDTAIIGNSLSITDTDDSEWASGFDLNCTGGISYSEIRNNYMELLTYNPDPAITGGTCRGIQVYGNYGVGGPGTGEGLAIMGNTVILESESVVNGIRVSTPSTVVSPIYASGAGYGIRNNTITGSTYGHWFIQGIDLSNGGGADTYVDVTGNYIDVSSWDSVALTGGAAYGINLSSDGDLFGTVSNNPLIRVEGEGDIFGIYASNNGDIGSTVNPFTVIGNPSITCINHETGAGYRLYGIRLYNYNSGSDIFARITGNTNIDLTAVAGDIYGISVYAGSLVGDSSSSFATLISGNSLTFNSGAGITNYGMHLRTGAWGTTNWVDLGAGTAGSTGSNGFTLLGTGATWSGGYAGGIIRENFTIPTDRIDP